MAGRLAKGLKVLAWFAIVPAVVGGVYGWIIFSQERRLQARIAEAKASGLLLTAEDMQKAFPKPEGENAAPVYLAFNENFRKYIFTDTSVETELLSVATRKELTVREWTAIETYLAECEGLLAPMEAASHMPVCYFEMDWSKGIDMPYDGFSSVFRVQNHLLARFAVRLRKNDVDGAISDLGTMSRMAAQTRSLPTQSGQSTWSRATHQVFSAIKFGLWTRPEDEKLRQTFREIIERMPEEQDLRLVVLPEAYLQYWIAENVVGTPRLERVFRDFGWSSDENSADRLRSLQSPLSQRPCKDAVLELWTPVIKDYDQADELDRRAREIQQRAKVFDAFFSMNPPGLMFNRSSLTTLQANKRCLIVALDAFEECGRTGAFPRMPRQNFQDPFDGQPLRYVSDGKSIKVWSIGRNKVDDGGVNDPMYSQRDEVFDYPHTFGLGSELEKLKQNRKKEEEKAKNRARRDAIRAAAASKSKK